MHLDVTINRSGFAEQVQLALDGARQFYCSPRAFDYLTKTMTDKGFVCQLCKLIARSDELETINGRIVCKDGYGHRLDVDKELVRPRNEDSAIGRHQLPLVIWSAFVSNLPRRDDDGGLLPLPPDQGGVPW